MCLNAFGVVLVDMDELRDVVLVEVVVLLLVLVRHGLLCKLLNNTNLKALHLRL